MKKGDIIGGVCTAAGLTINFIMMTMVVRRTNRVLDNVHEAADQMNIDVPDPIIAAAVREAVFREADKASTMVRTEIREDIHAETKKAIKDAYEDVKDDVKEELEKQIKDVNIDSMVKDVKKDSIAAVSRRALNEVLDDLGVFTRFGNSGTRSSNVADVIKACKDANMAGWQIENIVKTLTQRS